MYKGHAFWYPISTANIQSEFHLYSPCSISITRHLPTYMPSLLAMFCQYTICTMSGHNTIFPACIQLVHYYWSCSTPYLLPMFSEYTICIADVQTTYITSAHVLSVHHLYTILLPMSNQNTISPANVLLVHNLI